MNFPELYPNRLKKISWCLDDGEVAGPHRYYNKHLSAKVKGDSCFMKNAMIDILTKKGINHTAEIDAMVQYLIENVTVYLKDGENMFQVAARKDKDKKQTFSLEEWAKRLEACGMDKKFAKSFLTTMLKELVDFYNQMI